MATTQESFRRELIKRDQFCILSNICHEVCEAAHIVNKEWLLADKKDLKFAKGNGILLNSNLHKEFDLHYWTIKLNEEIWKKKKNKDFGETETVKCEIQLYPIAIKKRDSNLKLEIFNYLDSGIELPLECVNFVMQRNKIVTERLSNPIKYASDDIRNGLKKEYRKSNAKKKVKVKKPKKRHRYKNDELIRIQEWFKNLRECPDKKLRVRFAETNGLDSKRFESRFSSLWKKYKN